MRRNYDDMVRQRNVAQSGSDDIASALDRVRDELVNRVAQHKTEIEEWKTKATNHGMNHGVGPSRLTSDDIAPIAHF